MKKKEKKLCTWENDPEKCRNCVCGQKLKCRMNFGDLLKNWALNLGFFIPAATGLFWEGRYWSIFIYLAAYALLFHIIVPAFLCRHCPFYAEDGFFLHCLDHYGSIKLYKFNPGPLNVFEKICVFLGFLFLFGFPLLMLALSRQWIFFIPALAGAVWWFCAMLKYTCSACLNFSCPMNGVPEKLKKAYLEKNPILKNNQ